MIFRSPDFRITPQFPRSRWLTAALLACAGLAAADVPKKQPVSKYSKLWTDSPFTAKPPPGEAAPEINPFEDYVLGGVSPVAGGYWITLFNRKNPGERKYITSGQTSPEGFQIAAVTQKPGDPMATTVRITNGSQTGTVAFDQKMLVIKAAAPQQPPRQPNMPGQPPMPQPANPGQPWNNANQPGNPNQPVTPALRQPRPRIVLPNGGTTGDAGNNGSQHFQPQPQVLPPDTIQQPQPQNPGVQQRFRRR